MQSFIIMLLSNSITMSVFALAFIAVMPSLSRRYSAKGLYYTWLIIVIGLIIPFRPHFENAIIKIIPTETATTILQIGSGQVIAGHIENSAFPVALQSLSWWQVAAIVWLAGVMIFLGYNIVRHFRFLKMVRRWSDVETNEQILVLLQSLKTKMEISQHIPLYRCQSIESPMMIGFLNPRILLPKVEFAQGELQYIFMHELVHYKRKDLWYKCLVLITVAIHWFNPIVYLVAKAIDMLCEMSCDVEVVGSSDTNTRQQYSQTIISVAKYQSKMKTVLSTNFYGGKEGMKKRIFLIMDMGKKKVGIVIISCALLVTTGTGCAFAVNASADTSNAILTTKETDDSSISDNVEDTTYAKLEKELEEIDYISNAKVSRTNTDELSIILTLDGTDTLNQEQVAQIQELANTFNDADKPIQITVGGVASNPS